MSVSLALKVTLLCGFVSFDYYSSCLIVQLLADGKYSTVFTLPVHNNKGSSPCMPL